MKTLINILTITLVSILNWITIFAETANGANAETIEEPTTIFWGWTLKEGLWIVKDQVKWTGITTSDSITSVILWLVRFALPFAGLLAFIGVIYGGFLYLTSGFSDQTEEAKKIIMYSAIWLIIIFIAYPLITTIINMQG